MRRWCTFACAALLALVASGCAGLSPLHRAQAVEVAELSRDTTIECDDVATACARPSPLRALAVQAMAASTPAAPRHHVLLLDYGQDALLARLDLIRGARSSIDLQTYIFDEDDAGHLVIDELLAAARRGVRVRVLVDQLSALRHVDTLAALSAAHVNFHMRIFNPVLGRARISYPQYVLAAACCWRELNHRMHSKVLLVDGIVGITGGRNYQDRYFDWDDSYNFRDRDVLVAGPVSAEMAANFQMFWDSPRSVRVAELRDVGKRLLSSGAPRPPHPAYASPARVAAMRRVANDPLLVQERLVAAAMAVGEVRYIADPPDKLSADESAATSTAYLHELIAGARQEVLLQTPYLVLSRPAQALFEHLHEAPDGPRVVISTNSLAATDSFITYALSYKYKRRYLRDFGFNIFEYKPFPEDAPIDVDATGAVRVEIAPDGTANLQVVDPVADAQVKERMEAHQDDERHAHVVAAVDRGRGSGRGQRLGTPLQREYSALRYAGVRVNEPVPLKRAGVRIGLHSKSLVVDGRVGVVGTHNFDPRGDNLNTESALAVDDPDFAQALARSIRRDMTPENAWVIARRDPAPVLPGLEYSVAKISEHLPVFDLWPTRYATSYRFVPGPDCPHPLYPDDPEFRACHEPVGDFPEVDLGIKSVLTRIFTAFGVGLAPIL